MSSIKTAKWTRGGSGEGLSVAKNMKVGNLEDKFEEEFGLKVQVAGSDDSYPVSYTHLTLPTICSV